MSDFAAADCLDEVPLHLQQRRVLPDAQAECKGEIRSHRSSEGQGEESIRYPASPHSAARTGQNDTRMQPTDEEAGYGPASATATAVFARVVASSHYQLHTPASYSSLQEGTVVEVVGYAVD
jgi:hypothetical protein